MMIGSLFLEVKVRISVFAMLEVHQLIKPLILVLIFLLEFCDLVPGFDLFEDSLL